MESIAADVPRVILDPDSFNHVDGAARKLMSDEPDDGEHVPWRQYLATDRDGLYFVDYLGSAVSEEDKSGKKIEILGDHKSSIVRESRAAGGNLKALEKYRWLAKYHNRSVVDAGFVDEDSVLIKHPWLL